MLDYLRKEGQVGFMGEELTDVIRTPHDAELAEEAEEMNGMRMK
jgi:hypothetical protein